MQQSLVTIAMLAGGVGLFMLAVSMITDGLKSAAGHVLRHLLGRWTRSPAHGILTGAYHYCHRTVLQRSHRCHHRFC